jgi:Flp pilus assembly protein TadD
MLFDTRSGQQVAAMSDQASEDSLPELAGRCAQRLRAQLGVRIPENGRPSLDSAAMEPYARGVEHLRQGDALNARTYLEKAAAADPANPLIHSALAAAWSQLGLDIRAREEAKTAFDSAAALPRVEQLEIEARYRVIAHDWPRAIEVYQALFTLLPDDLEYGLLLAKAETSGGKGQDALTAVNALRKLPPPLKDDPRVDMAEAQAAGSLSDFARTRKAAQAAADKAKSQGSRLLYAKARLLVSGAMQNLGSAGFAEVRTEARQICEQLGDRACVAAAYRIEGNATVFEDPAASRRLYLAALEIANQIGNSLEKLNALNGLAYAAKLQGDLAAAENYYRSALDVATEIGPQKRASISLDLAEVWTDEGHTEQARTLIEQSLEKAEQAGEQLDIGMSHAGLAHVLVWEGKTAEAVVKYKEAIDILRRINVPGLLGATLLEFGSAQLEQADLAGGRKSFDECRKLSQAYPGGFLGADIEMAFARLSFAESHLADAASHARLALHGFIAAGREGARFEAAALLTRSLIDQHSIPEASEVLAQVPFADPKKFPPESVLQLEIARCYLNASTGRRSDAIRMMEGLQGNAARWGAPKLEREAQQAKSAIAKLPATTSSPHPRTARLHVSTLGSSRPLPFRPSQDRAPQAAPASSPSSTR